MRNPFTVPTPTSLGGKVYPLWQSCLYDYFYPAIWVWGKLVKVFRRSSAKTSPP
jgi:hypothetical protein